MHKSLTRWTRFQFLGFICGCSLLCVVILLPIYQVNDLSGTERVEAETAARDVLIKGIGGSLVFLTAFISWKNFQTNQEKQVNERFFKAIEMISSADTYLRLGGIYALERIARDSEKDQHQIMQVLSAFVRHRTPREDCHSIEEKEPYPYLIESLDTQKMRYYDSLKPENQYLNDYYDTLYDVDDHDRLFGKEDSSYKRWHLLDVQAAISAIGNRKHLSDTDKPYIDLSQTKLVNIKFKGNFDNVSFCKTHFRCPIFLDASFHKADFSRAFFEKAKVIKTSLTKAKFQKAVFGLSIVDKSEFINANFSGASISGNTTVRNCNFTNAIFKDSYLGRPIPIDPAFRKETSDYVDFDQQSRIENSIFRNSDLAGMQVFDVEFTSGSLRKANFQDSILKGVRFKSTTLAAASLENSSLGDEFKETDYHSSHGQYSSKHKRLKQVVFENSDLQGASFLDAKIYHADFQSALGLSTTQIKTAKSWKAGKYDDNLSKSLGIHKNTARD